MSTSGPVMADNHRRFRWLVALIVLAIAVWFLLDALEKTSQDAERQAVRLMLNQVRSALVVRGAEAMLARDERLESLQGLNPLRLLRWEGGQAGPTADCAEWPPDKRGWCFDSRQSWLVYQPAQPLEVEGRTRAPGGRFVWQVGVEYARTVKNGKMSEKRAIGLKLVEIDGNQVSKSY